MKSFKHLVFNKFDNRQHIPIFTVIIFQENRLPLIDAVYSEASTLRRLKTPEIDTIFINKLTLVYFRKPFFDSGYSFLKVRSLFIFPRMLFYIKHFSDFIHNVSNQS